MFGSNKTKEPGKSSNMIPSATSHSLNSLVQGTVVEGDVHSKNDIRVDGTIKGSLKCDSKVIIGPTGAVEGEISCVNAVIEGRFEGDLSVHEKLTLSEKANVSGTITYGKIVVQPGAVIVGDLRKGAPKSKSSAIVNQKQSAKETPVPGKASLRKESARR
jgi:cytoskeletal protein CcmA (bactofilin family)